MSSIDDLKNKLNIDNLDKGLRNEMYQKFVDKGGEVIKDKKKSTIIKFDREQQKLMKEKEQNSKKAYKSKYENKKYFEKEDKNQQQETKKKRYFRVYIIGFFQGIFSFSGYFTKKFSVNMHEPFSKIFEDIYQITSQIMKLETSKQWEVADILNVTNTFGFEILVRFNDLYDKDGLDNISNYFSTTRSVICKSVLNDIKKIFKELVILYPYWESSKQVLWESQQVYQDMTTINPVVQKSKINKSIDRLFSYYFSRFLTIINYNIGTKIPFEFKFLHQFVKIDPNKDMGSITNNLKEKRKQYTSNIQKEKDEQIKKLKEEVERKEAEKIPNYVKKGLSLIDKIVDNIPEKIQKNADLKNFDTNDKMLYFLIIFMEFDVQYSFIMTTSQIKYNPRLEYGTRIDIKSDLENLYIRYNEIMSNLKEYIKLMEQVVKVKDDFKGSPYALQQKMTNLDTKRIRSFFEIKAKAVSFFKKLALILQSLIKDYNEEKRLLQNGDEMLHFELNRDGRNKFENVKIINTIIYIFSFVSAFHFYLTNGKLSQGGSIYIIDETNTVEENKENNNLKEAGNDKIDTGNENI